MGSPIIFARNARLTVAGPTISLASIPQTAAHLAVMVNARYATDTTNAQFLGMRFNGDSGANYRNNASYASTTSFGTGIGGDGFGVTQMIIGEVNENQAGTAGMFSNFQGTIPRYAESIAHSLFGMGQFIIDDGNVESEYVRHVMGGYHNSLAPITQLSVVNENAANFAIGSEIQVWGFAATGDAHRVARSAGTLALDFAGDAFRDIPLSAGANVFTATNPTLGTLLQCRLSGGDGTSTITLPAGTELLEDSYVAGDPAWLSIRCTDETGPAFIANLKDVL